MRGDQSPTLPYLAITNRHDGTGACALRATAVRIVCANTFRAAELEGERTGTTFSFVHKSGWRNHFLTKSRRYSVTFGELRTARAKHRRATTQPPAPGRDAWGRPLDETIVLVLATTIGGYAGHGQTTPGAELAAASAARAGEHQHQAFSAN